MSLPHLGSSIFAQNGLKAPDQAPRAQGALDAVIVSPWLRLVVRFVTGESCLAVIAASAMRWSRACSNSRQGRVRAVRRPMAGGRAGSSSASAGQTIRVYVLVKKTASRSAVGRQLLAVAVREAADQALAAQAPEVVGHLARVIAGQQSGDELAQGAVG